jgi:hypothetical protein
MYIILETKVLRNKFPSECIKEKFNNSSLIKLHYNNLYTSLRFICVNFWVQHMLYLCAMRDRGVCGYVKNMLKYILLTLLN